MAKKRTRRFFGRIKKHYRRHKGFGGIMGDVLSGAVLGAGIQFAAPTINSYVPSIAGIRPTNLVLVGGGIGAKSFLHKGGKFADAAIILGVAGIAADLVSGNFGGSGTVGGYAND